MIVLDSNTISYYLRGDPQIVPRMQAMRPADIGIPAIVEFELRYGLARLPENAGVSRLAALNRLLSSFQTLPFDSECAMHAAQVRAALESVGQTIGPYDTLIAATAIRYQSTLITRNSKEFSRVSGLQWLDWHAEN